MLKRRVFSLGFLIGLMAIVYFSFTVYASHTWSNYRWQLASGEVLALDVGDNTTQEWQGFVNEAIVDWNVSPVINLTEVNGNGSADCSPTLGRMEVCNANYGDNGWLGLAQIWLTRSGRNSYISQGTAKMNDTYFNIPGGAYNNDAWRDVVMCQEIGHIFGIAHNDEDFSTTTGTCMDYSSNPEPNRQPNAHDYELLLQIYGDPGDGGDTGGTPCRGGPKKCPADFAHVPQQALASQGEWGQLVSNSRGHSMYVRNLGNGVIVITDVLWVEGAGPGQ